VVAAVTAHRPAVRVLLLAVLALAAVVLVRPPHAPPLYDGLGFPDEPYRWVVPPPGADRTPQAATPAVATLPVEGGTTGAGQGLSGEQGPQIALAVTAGAFAAPSGPTQIRLEASPRPVPAVPPDDGQVVSNLYALTATAGGRPVPLAHGRGVLVNLRADQATDRSVVICRWTGHAWEQLPTQQVGADVYAASLDAVAPVAVVRLDPGVRPTVAAPSARAVPAVTTSQQAPPRGPTDGPGGDTLWLAVGGVAVVLAGGLLVLRRRVGGDQPGEPGEPD
jgi:hypothetical protein